MRLLLLTFTFLIGMVFNSFQSSAQIDSVFWFAAPWVTPSHAGNTPVALRISTFNSPTTVRVFQPAGAYDSTFTIPPNTLNSHFLTPIINTLESKPGNTIQNYGLKVEADTLVTIVYEVLTGGNNPETYSLKGQNALGMEFVCPFQTTWDNGSYNPIQPKSMISIVATEDNTTVWITPRTNVIGHPANVTYSITLNEGQVYTAENIVQNTSVPGNNLSGTVVVSNKKIAITVSDDSVRNSGGGCRDLMGDQIVPSDVVGKNYIVNRGNMFTNSEEGVFIVATENFTEVTVTTDLGTSTQLLNQGDTWKFVLESTMPRAYIESDKNVYVLQASGFGCEVGAALLPPVNCAGSDQVSFTRTNSQTFILTVLCPSIAVNDFTLNGSTTLVPGSAFNVIPGTGGVFSSASITFNTSDIPVGTSNLLTNSTDLFGLGVINGGGATGCYYHYMSSFNRKVFVTAGNDTTLCNGDPAVALEGTVSGGTVTGEWSVINGTGTFNNANDLSSTYSPSASDYSQGTLSFVLSSTGNCEPVTDTMVVTFIQSPEVDAGLDDTYCKNNVGPIDISGAFQYTLTGSWSGGNGGVFGNPGSPNTTYTPSPADLSADSTILYFTSSGSFFSCPDTKDSVVLYYTPAPIVEAGPNQLVCTSSLETELAGTVTGASTTGVWSTSGNGGFSPTQSDLNAEYLLTTDDIAAGSVTLYLSSTNNGNCLAEMDSLEIQIIDYPVVEITSEDSICSDNTFLNLSGTVSSGFSSEWSSPGFGTISNPNNLNTVYSITPVDVNAGYVDIFLSSQGICPPETDSLRVIFLSPPQVNAGQDQAFCQNANIQLNGVVNGGDETGSWTSLGTGSFSPSSNFLDATYIPSNQDLQNGSVSLILSSTSSFGCSPDEDTLLITFNEIPTADFTFTNVCQSLNMPFNSTSTTSVGVITNWEWDFGNGSTSIIENPQHLYSTFGNIPVRLIVTASNGCTDTVSHIVEVYPMPQPSFQSSIACEDYPTYFTNTSTIPSGTIDSYTYDFNGINSSNNEDSEFVFPNSGDYSVSLTATSDEGCAATTISTVTVNSIPNAQFTANPNPALVNQDILFSDVTGGNIVSWQWEFGDGQGDNQESTVHSYNNGGVYYVTLTVEDGIGCRDSITQSISIALLPVLPTGFSPNGDGENDVFLIRGGPFESVDFKVYNNWGELLFVSNDAANGWDGTFKGKQVPLGVYTWTFVVNMGSDFIVKESGDVTLIR